MSDILASYELRSGNVVTIMLDDPTFVRAETVLVDLRSGEVSALLHQKLHSLGAAPANIVSAISEQHDVVLSAVRIDGSSLQLRSEVVFVH